MKIFNISFLCIFFIAKSMLAANPELVKKYGNMVRNYELNITNQNLGDEDAFAIAEVVSKDRTLNGLHLSDNKIGDAGALALAKAIEKHPLLMRISLSNNNIGDKGGVAFADMIKNNVVINSLDLLGNKEMGNETAEAFAQALKKNRALSTLYLDSNIMTDTGATAIADALKK